MPMSLARHVEDEMLDHLAAADPRAQRSRDDLRRLHRAMATLSITQSALDGAMAGSRPRTLLELGAGDGSMALRVAQSRAAQWPGVQLTLLDRLNLVAPETLEGLLRVGWCAEVVTEDVFDWLAKATDVHWDVVCANLFLHHFSTGELRRLMAGIAMRTRVFQCCEPRRSLVSLAASHLVGAIGAGPVTRRDAVLSVRAGFQGRELSALWPDSKEWVLREYPAGLFSHCFLAVRN